MPIQGTISHAVVSTLSTMTSLDVPSMATTSLTLKILRLMVMVMALMLLVD